MAAWASGRELKTWTERSSPVREPTRTAAELSPSWGGLALAASSQGARARAERKSRAFVGEEAYSVGLEGRGEFFLGL
jgi:hypothetical protein